MTLALLSTKDLTRSLAVSRHWHKTILSSVILRRNLFLDYPLKREFPPAIQFAYRVLWGEKGPL